MKRIIVLLALVALAGTFFFMSYVNSDNYNSIYTDFDASYYEDIFAPAVDYNRVNYAKSISQRMVTKPAGTPTLLLPQMNPSSVDFFGKSSNNNAKTRSSGFPRMESPNPDFYADNSVEGKDVVNKKRVETSNQVLPSFAFVPVQGRHVSGATNQYTPIPGGPGFTSTNDLSNSKAFSDNEDDEDGFEKGADEDPDDIYNDSPISGILPALFIALGYTLNIAIRRKRKD
jgi:hypothetical protein